MRNARYAIYFMLLIPLLVIWSFWLSTAMSTLFTSPSDVLMGFGRLFGLSAVYFVLLQIFFRSRIQPVEKFVGYETLNYLHKKNGYIVYTLIILHPIFISLGYSLAANNTFFAQITTIILTYPGVLNAFFAVVLFTTVVFSSVYLVRKRLPYELWYVVHLTTYLAVLLAWDHQLKVGTDFQVNQWFVYFWYALYVVVIGSLIYWRFWRQLYMFGRQRFYLAKVVKEATDTHSFYIGGRHIENFHFEPGQFAFLRFLSKDGWWQSHPFSFSQSEGKEFLRFTIKASGDFTGALTNMKEKTPVVIDGPHGEFTLQNVQKKKTLLIAGGVGITPLRAILEKADGKNTVLLYANKDEKDIILQSELEALMKEKGFSMYYVVSQNPNYKGLKGRIDLGLIQSLVKNLKEYDVFVCGPAPMLNALKKELGSVLPKSQIHTEEFAL